jgi:hypothetical protein
MNTAYLPLATIGTLLFAGCAGTISPEQHAQYTNEARTAVNQAVQTLGGELKAAIKDGGPVNAISVCKDKAPMIAASVSEQHGVKLRRVSTKNRNPKGVPDAWETKVLADFEQRLARGEAPANLEYSEVVKDGDTRQFRYMKGLVTQEVCMTCHGTKDTIPEAVQAKLSAEYPNDKATGYLPNTLRGAASLKRPL